MSTSPLSPPPAMRNNASILTYLIIFAVLAALIIGVILSRRSKKSRHGKYSKKRK